MATIVSGRHTHRHDGAAVVFLLGIRVNRPLAVRTWLPAWAEFNRRTRQSEGTIGLWHEALVAAAGGHESVYVHTPAIGLAAAYGPVPASGRRQTARGRLAATA